jgi:hypothetical protein
MVIVESSFFEGFMSSFSAVAMRHTSRSDTVLGRKRYLSFTSQSGNPGPCLSSPRVITYPVYTKTIAQ